MFLQPFRVLFPSWKFFSEAEVSPELWICLGNPTLSPWQPALKSRSRRSWANLLLNANENDFLARHALLARCVQELDEGYPARASLELIEALVLQLIPGEAREFQFKLTVGDEEVYVSPFRGSA